MSSFKQIDIINIFYSAMRYILYARRSSEEKTKQVQSIEDQIGALQPLITQNHLDIRHILTESRTAKEPGRPVFNQMIQMLEAGEADAILCWHLNRLTRNELDSGVIRWLLRTGVIREIVTPHRTYRSEDNALITAVESAMGEQFIVELIHNSERGMLSKVEKGWFPGRVPPGYLNDKLTHTIVRDEDRWDIIRRAWQEMLSGNKSVLQIHRVLNQEWGYRSPSGLPLPKSTLYHIFTNPFYTGLFVFRDKLYEGKHEAMVSRQEFDFVQARLSRKGNSRRRRHEFAFSGLITCGHCGRAVCADRKRKIIKSTGEERYYTYYACSSAGSRCPRSGRIREEEITAVIKEQIQSIKLPQDLINLAREVAARSEAETQEAAEAIERSRIASAVRVNRQLDELLTLRLEQAISTEEYQQRKERLQSEHNAGQEEHQRDDERSEKANRSVINVAKFGSEAQSDFAKDSVAVRCSIARQLGTQYILRRGKLTFELHGLLGLVREHIKMTASDTAPLELLDIGSHSHKTAHHQLFCTQWGGLLEAIRKKSYEEKLYFD